ncbi:hypothetical protein [Roseivirga pacifica]|uniref:hypothetical protein n=1 Tax=Roseivirga pacifica TaxID=1267423 RepID=UPI002094F609|nr:hypothetical protein [Roseivirga pacifica]MCO6359168.1 hypothetical protein [Roseivirga pacifica]MCO6365196.1 hypothetical protein [Roseivirga pacifica]MCO6372074.1 hypothetical protein [Roseivirga pacifica]MCO6375815.1 hypothetical protein [Roseivirga pacifica]MCO6379452.1 hypothetical protein [Roseivirga pacifica]
MKKHLKKVALGFAVAGLFAFTNSFACDWNPTDPNTRRGTCTGGGEGGGNYCELIVTPYYSCTVVQIIDVEE